MLRQSTWRVHWTNLRAKNENQFKQHAESRCSPTSILIYALQFLLPPIGRSAPLKRAGELERRSAPPGKISQSPAGPRNPTRGFGAPRQVNIWKSLPSRSLARLSVVVMTPVNASTDATVMASTYAPPMTIIVVMTPVNASTDATVMAPTYAPPMTIIGLLNLRVVHVFRRGDAWFGRWTPIRLRRSKRLDQGESFRSRRSRHHTHSKTKQLQKSPSFHREPPLSKLLYLYMETPNTTAGFRSRLGWLPAASDPAGNF